jgi:hypothetical protein
VIVVGVVSRFAHKDADPPPSVVKSSTQQ